MIASRQQSKDTLDEFGIGVRADLQDLVVVNGLVFHQRVTPVNKAPVRRTHYHQ
jgi:hypothetical protein